MWTICSIIVILFELFGFTLLWIAMVGMIVHDKTPKWFKKIFDLFFAFDD